MSRSNAAGGRGKRPCSKQRSKSRTTRTRRTRTRRTRTRRTRTRRTRTRRTRTRQSATRKPRSDKLRCKPQAATPAYRHPLASAMIDLLGQVLDSGRRVGRRGHTLLWTPLLLSLCAILMSWDPSPCLNARFDAAGLALGNLLPRHARGATYQGWIKALLADASLHQHVAERLRQVLQQMTIDTGCWLREGWCALTADSSKFNCPRTAANEKAFGCSARKGKGQQGVPQQLLTLLWHMGSGLPWAWEAGDARASERKQLLTMLPLLPPQGLLVADAGFVGYDLLNAIGQAQRHFLIRIGSNVSLLHKLGFWEEKQDTVYLWPSYDTRKNTRRRNNPPLVLRLIRVQQPGKKTVYLLSNVLEASRLSQRSAQVLYAMRWGVEVFFRSLKQTLCRRTLASAAPRQARQELHWAVIGIAVLGMLSVRERLRAGKDPLSFSVALALKRVRLAAQSPARTVTDFSTQLAEATKDEYRRTRSRQSRNYPRRKRCKPPGRPRVHRATKTEMKMARTFHENSVVQQFTA